MPTDIAPTYDEESALLKDGYAVIAGVDEAGRGNLAGPVVAGAVVLPLHPKGDWTAGMRDSKRLTPRQRQAALQTMREESIAMGYGIASNAEIDAIGIVEATRTAMARAIDALPVRPDFLLLDAILLPDLATDQRSIIKGDAKCLSIAAASIVAKETRDSIMREYDDEYPAYGFAQHKGYATRQHLDALENFGPCEIHRYSFAPVRRLVESML
ncbi:MAG: ribonuclease HII [Chloroflexi bacterium]|nr:ribonuclease HII [Chloroflexota bacterium]